MVMYLELIIFSSLTFLGLFMIGFGIVQKNKMFIVAGGLMVMLLGTSIVSGGLSFPSGAINNDLGNGTVVTTDTLTTQDDWLTEGVGRAMFWLGSLVTIFSVALEDEEEDRHKV